MSDATPSSIFESFWNDPSRYLELVMAMKRIDIARKTKKAADEAERHIIWETLLVSPLIAMLPRWTDCWTTISSMLRKKDCHSVASRLVAAAELLLELQRLWTTWYWAAHARKDSEVDATFSHLAPDAKPEWACFWAQNQLNKSFGIPEPGIRPPQAQPPAVVWEYYDGPIPTLRRTMTRWEVEPLSDDAALGSFDIRELVSGLVHLDGTGWRPTEQEKIAEYLSVSNSWELFADLCPLLAGVILPGPLGLDLPTMMAAFPKRTREVGWCVLSAARDAGLTLPDDISPTTDSSPVENESEHAVSATPSEPENPRVLSHPSTCVNPEIDLNTLALAHLASVPQPTLSAIAERLGINRELLYTSPTFQTFRNFATKLGIMKPKGSKSDVRRGRKTKNGDLEAIHEDPTDDE